MSDVSLGDGWWVASDGKWYAPELHPDFVEPQPLPPQSPPAQSPQPPAGYDPSLTETVPTGVPQPGYNPHPDPIGQPQPTYQAGQPTAPETLQSPVVEQSSRNRFLLLGVGGLVLLVALGFLGSRLFGGGSTSGGAASPTDAVDQMIASINEADPVGLLEILDPDEISSWVDAALAVVEAQSGGGDSQDDDGDDDDIEIPSEVQDLIDAVDYSVTGLNGEAPTYTVTQLDDDGRISRVRLDGFVLNIVATDDAPALVTRDGDTDAAAFRFSSANGAEITVEDTANGLDARTDAPDFNLPERDFAEDFHLDVVTVEKDGKWFVSIGYSVLESTRQAWPTNTQPDFGRAHERIDSGTGGADSPTAVIEQLASSLESLDYDEAIALVDPLALPYLHDYQPVIDAEADQTAINNDARAAGIRFDELDLEVGEWEDRTLVLVGDVTGRTAEFDFVFDTSRWCLDIEDGVEQEEVCLADNIPQELLDLTDTSALSQDQLPERLGFIVSERNDRWYVDPAATVAFVTTEIAQAVSDAGITADDPAEGDDSNSPTIPFTPRPVATLGESVIDDGDAGFAGVALDLRNAPTFTSTQGDQAHIALVNVTTTQPGTYVNSDSYPLQGQAWLVAWDLDSANIDIPLVAANTQGSLNAELTEVATVELSTGALDSQIDADGRPVVFTIAADAANLSDITVEGADAGAIYSFADNGVSLPGQLSSTLATDALFIVVTGDPGQSFTMTVGEPEPPPAPTPTPTVPDPTGDPLVDEYAALVLRSGFTAVDEPAPGGFFDGCGGPNDPTATTYAFARSSGGRMLVTTYSSAEQAASEFALLDNLTPRCEAFTSIEVTLVDRLGADEILVTWVLDEEPETTNFEYYWLAGSTIGVALDDELPDVTQRDLLAEWAASQ